MRSLLLCLSLLVLESSCSSIPNVPLITRIDAYRCAYAYTMSDIKGIIDDEILLNGKTCVDYVNEGLIIPADSWQELKKFILKKCKVDPKFCNGAGNWSDRINHLTSGQE